ncbi:hypothetical protein F0562_028485 [Nyssa sinensis]|uniref:Dirigent protein n=1 Tax=Nyssa sinensis TaxID=561372 RepID=A0A5J5B2I3_9ASTE|nr:hypothetical protein F0562_028485 [Nyssa sinensis]
MEGKYSASAWVLILCIATVPVHCKYHSDGEQTAPVKEKKTHLRFFLHDTISGKKPSSVMVAHANLTQGDNNPTPFGSVFVFDDPLTEGPEPTSRVIGNARGIYVSSSQGKDLSLVVYADYGFTTGKFNGSSISLFSRLPLVEAEPTHEVAVVGGRKKFRMARGFAKLKPHYFNATNVFMVVQGITEGPNAAEAWFKKLPHAKEKVTKLHFYFHDIASGKNPTAVQVAQPNATNKSPAFFGIIMMVDDPLTVRPEPTSNIMGRAQGFYGFAGMEEIELIMTMNIVFTEGEYNGSSLSILGRNPVFHRYREMPVVGGSGFFRLARGIATAKTYWVNFTSGDATVEYNIIVAHY